MFASCLVALKRAEYCTKRRCNGVWVDAHAPAVVATVVAGFNVGNCGGLRTLTKCVLGVVLHVEVPTELTTNGMHERIDGAVALTNEGLSGAIDVDLSGDLGMT